MIPLIENKKVSEYTSAYSSKLWLFEAVKKENLEFYASDGTEKRGLKIITN